MPARQRIWFLQHFNNLVQTATMIRLYPPKFWPFGSISCMSVVGTVASLREKLVLEIHKLSVALDNSLAAFSRTWLFLLKETLSLERHEEPPLKS
jgi:hypothetical protein